MKNVGGDFGKSPAMIDEVIKVRHEVHRWEEIAWRAGKPLFKDRTRDLRKICVSLTDDICK